MTGTVGMVSVRQRAGMLNDALLQLKPAVAKDLTFLWVARANPAICFSMLKKLDENALETPDKYQATVFRRLIYRRANFPETPYKCVNVFIRACKENKAAAISEFFRLPVVSRFGFGR